MRALRHLVLSRRGAWILCGGFLLSVLLIAWQYSTLIALTPTVMLQDRHGNYLADLGEQEVGFWPLPTLPRRAAAATLSLEDRRFYQHPGVDPVAVARAAWDNLRTLKRVSGASTLAMQVVRLQNPGPRALWRKGLEAISALLMTARYGRDAILEQYLRLVPYGNRAHGIAYAARRYLDKPVEDLSWAETAFLTAIPQAPAHTNPYTVSGRRRAVARASRIIQALYAEGRMRESERDLALKELNALNIPPRTERSLAAMHTVVGFPMRLESTPSSQPLIRTTLDLALQERVALLTAQLAKTLAPQGVRNAACLLIDLKSFEVLAHVGSTAYFDATGKGSIDYSRVQRLPGSTLKPFLYGHALEQQLLQPNSIVEDLERGPDGVGNMDERFLGPMLVREALANSRNVPAISLLRTMGLENGYSLLRRLGLIDARLPVQHFGIGMAVGGVPVTLEQLVTAYTVLAGEGRLEPLRWIREPGQVETPGPRIFQPTTARLLTLMLSDPMARLPSFPRMGYTEYPFPVAIKTGTSSNYRDAWAVAWSSRYMVGVWMGDPDYQPMHTLTGYSGAARLIHQILMSLHQEERQGLNDLSFPPPTGYLPTRLCSLSGKKPGDACERVVQEWLPPAVAEKLGSCDWHVRIAFDKRSNLPAHADTPRSRIELRAGLKLPPRYALWGQKSGHRLQTGGPPGAPDLLPNSRQNVSSHRLDRGIALTITSPSDSNRILMDPDRPAEASSLALRVTVNPPIPRVLWYVDGLPYRLVEYPYEVRWPLQAGRHTFQVEVPGAPVRSRRVTVDVQK